MDDCLESGFDCMMDTIEFPEPKDRTYNSEITCVKCGAVGVVNRTASLCAKCYGKSQRVPKPLREIHHNSEMVFASNFFSHSDWAPQAATFELGGTSYRPDFYDRRRNVFIEVAGTRQAYDQNRAKYKLFNVLFPKIKLEIRTTDGQLLEFDEEGRAKWPLK